MKKAIIYTRVASRAQLDGSSLEVQKRICSEFALKNGYEIVKVFVEKGESAITTNRTQLQALLAYIAKSSNEVDGLIIYKIDRLTRNAVDYALLKAQLSKYGVILITARENLEDTPVGRLMETMIASCAQYESEMRSEKIKQGMRAAKLQRQEVLTKQKVR